MKREKSDNTGRVGVHAVGLGIEKTLNWIFREYPTSDHGIDAHVEIVDQRRDATGRLIALQIKSGKSYFAEKVRGGYVFRGDTSHLNYWMRHSLPVIIVLHDPAAEMSYWQVVNQQTVEATEKGWKMTIPTSQVLDASARAELSGIATCETFTCGNALTKRIALIRNCCAIFVGSAYLFKLGRSSLIRSIGLAI